VFLGRGNFQIALKRRDQLPARGRRQNPGKKQMSVTVQLLLFGFAKRIRQK
jgi:hypothetical protein